MDRIKPEPILTDEQEREFDRLDSMGEMNALQIRHQLGALATEDVQAQSQPFYENAEQKILKFRPRPHARTPREKAWADTRPDLKPFPYGAQDSF